MDEESLRQKKGVVEGEGREKQKQRKETGRGGGNPERHGKLNEKKGEAMERRGEEEEEVIKRMKGRRQRQRGDRSVVSLNLCPSPGSAVVDTVEKHIPSQRPLCPKAPLGQSGCQSMNPDKRQITQSSAASPQILI